jgi:hypothetical protein
VFNLRIHVSSPAQYEMYFFFVIVAYLLVLYMLFSAFNQWTGWLAGEDAATEKKKRD